MPRLIAVVLAVLFSGCLNLKSEFLIDPPPRADEAIALIKARLGGGSFDGIYWYGPKAIAECPNGVLAVKDWDGECVGGFTVLYQGSVIPWDGVAPIHETALAHEMTHQVRGDPRHTRKDIWGADEIWDAQTPGSLVGDINTELARLGM